MRITAIKKTSILTIICAMIMIFAHTVIPHTYDCLDESQMSLESCCSGDNGQHFNDLNASQNTHHHCIVINIVYHPDSSREVDYSLTILSVEYFGNTYNLHALPLVIENEYRAPFNESIALRYLSNKLSWRAPPSIA